MAESLLKPRRRRKLAEVSIVPLVDVLMVLIFFFLMTMSFRQEKILNLTLPQIETAGANRAIDFLRVAITSDGDILLNEQAVTLTELKQGLEVAAMADDQRTILLMADEESQVRRLAEVMDACREAGLDAIRLQSRE